VTLYYPDISGFQGPISLKGALAVAAKVTEGTTFVSPAWDAQKTEAARQGTFLIAYHFLLAGNAAAQAAHARQHAGTTPLMVDFEPEPPSFPSLADCTEFIDAYRKLGGVTHLVYLPHWYWSRPAGQGQGGLGSPSLQPLIDRGMLLVSSDYTTYTDDAAGAGWQRYGGMTPAVWQYTDALQFNGQPVDFNAYRGSAYAGKQDPASVAAALAEFRLQAMTGGPKPPLPPHGPYLHFADGTKSLADIAAARNTSEQHLRALSETAYPVELARRPLRKGLPYFTSNP